jgi:hypothetical protein
MGYPDWQKIRRGHQEALSARLGFDCRNGGRRLGELVVEPLPDLPEKCHLTVSGTIVTIEQAIRIRDIIREEG